MGGWRNWSQNVLNGPPLPAPPSFTGLAMAGLAALATAARAGPDALRRSLPRLRRAGEAGQAVLERQDAAGDRRASGRRRTAPRFFTAAEWRTAERGLRPHPAAAGATRRARPVAALIDERCTLNRGDGFRLPTCRDARGLAPRPRRRSRPRRRPGTALPSTRWRAAQQDACCDACSRASSRAPHGRDCRAALLHAACCTTSSAPITPIPTLERDRLRRPRKPARLCRHRLRPARSLGSGGAQAVKPRAGEDPCR